MNQTIYRGRNQFRPDPIVYQAWLENTASRRELHKLEMNSNDHRDRYDSSVHDSSADFEKILKIEEASLKRTDKTGMDQHFAPGAQFYNQMGTYSMLPMIPRLPSEYNAVGNQTQQVRFDRVRAMQEIIH
jgi:hypothetical protein